MAIKLLFKILRRLAVMVIVLAVGGLYVGKMASGDSAGLLDLAAGLFKKGSDNNRSVNPVGLGGIKGLDQLGNLLQQKGMPEAENAGGPPLANEAAKPILRENEAKSDAQSPRENPGDWDSIESKTQICWYHKRTRKKVCELK